MAAHDAAIVVEILPEVRIFWRYEGAAVFIHRGDQINVRYSEHGVLRFRLDFKVEIHGSVDGAAAA